MSIDIDRFLVETASRITTTIDENGYQKYGASTSVPCLFRDITSISDLANREELGVEGILWLPASEASFAVVGAIYYHPDEGYVRIKSRIKAKRLVADNTVQFVKCGVEHHRQVS